MQDIETPKLAALQDAIYLNSKLFARVQKVYDERATLKLDAESLRLVEVDYRAFVKAGAKLNDADKTKLKKLNEEEAVLSNTFTNKLLAGTKAAAYVTTDQVEAGGVERCAGAGGCAGGEGARGGGVCASAAEYDAAAGPDVHERSRGTEGAVRGLVDEDRA